VEPGDEYEAVVADLIGRLKALKNPFDGTRLLPIVKRREELFAGKRLHQLPDVFVEFLDQPFEGFMQEYEVPEVFMDSGWANGTHRRNGLYIGAGPSLAPGEEVKDLEIFDVAPNVLHMMGHAIPEHMDGRFRPDLFAQGQADEARYGSFDAGDGGRYGITEDEERDLEEKLRGLGYL
jgi:predicted AlkP superfamily phosphohydrolase/phosphomutase